VNDFSNFYEPKILLSYLKESISSSILIHVKFPENKFNILLQLCSFSCFQILRMGVVCLFMVSVKLMPSTNDFLFNKIKTLEYSKIKLYGKKYC